MADAVLKNVRLGGTLTDITVSDGKIAAIGKTDRAGIDGGGATVRPGLFDIHTHGLLGHDVMTAAPDDLSRAYLSVGTTSFLATTMTAPLDDIARVCARYEAPVTGARAEGVHLEGPFLSPAACGAQNAAFLREPDIRGTRDLPHVRMITLAPELSAAPEFIRETDAVVSLGHTRADYDTALTALRAGAKCLSHTCNAMPPLHHREPGVIGAAITAGAYAQVITDGIHIHPSVVLALYRIFGAERMILISDSMPATGLPGGDYPFGGQTVRVRDGIARTESGALAGSTATLFDCVTRAISFGIPEDDAFRMASETPAALFGMKKGKIAVGYDAEFLLLDDEGHLVRALVL